MAPRGSRPRLSAKDSLASAFVYGLQGGQLLQRGVAPYRLVGVDVAGLPLLAWHLDAGYLLGECSVFGGGGGALVAAERPLVLLFAGDVEFLGAVGAEADHVDVLEGVEEAVLHHGVDHRGVAHARSPPRLLREIRGVGHALHTAGEEHVVVSGPDQGLRERRAPQA